MKAIAASALLFGVALGGLTYVNSSSSRYSWLVAGTAYIVTLFAVQLFQSRATPKEFLRFNVLVGLTLTILAVVDTVVLHRGVFKDMDPSLAGLLYRTGVLLVLVGVPTAIIGTFMGWKVARVRASPK